MKGRYRISYHNPDFAWRYIRITLLIEDLDCLRLGLHFPFPDVPVIEQLPLPGIHSGPERQEFVANLSAASQRQVQRCLFLVFIV